MINQMLSIADFRLPSDDWGSLSRPLKLARKLTLVESGSAVPVSVPTATPDAPSAEPSGDGFSTTTDVQQSKLDTRHSTIPVIGLTGTGGAGKSTLTDELVRRFLSDFQTPHQVRGRLSASPCSRSTRRGGGRAGRSSVTVSG